MYRNMIPYTLKSEYGMEAVLACGDMDLHGSYVDQVPGLQLDCFPFSWAGKRQMPPAKSL